MEELKSHPRQSKVTEVSGVLVGVSGIEPDPGVQDLLLNLCSGILLSDLVDHMDAKD